jgi:HSP20 family protein
MAHSIDRYLRQLPGGNRQRPSERLWAPAADVYRTREGWLVKVDLAGVRPEEIGIEVAGRVLVIRGCRRDTTFSETVAYHQLEITYSRFEKTLRFPCRVEGASIEEYRDGLLTIRLRESKEDCEDSDQPSAPGGQPEETDRAVG